jgi:hypothetical protein
MAAKMQTETPYVPLELLASQILSRLPVGSLLRFRCVCAAWRDTIDGDESFHREHLHLQKPSLLLAPQVRHYMTNWYWARSTTGFYRWEPRSKYAVTLLHRMADDHTLREMEAAHDLAHCDGLVLLPSEATLRVLNPAKTLDPKCRSVDSTTCQVIRRSASAKTLDPRHIRLPDSFTDPYTSSLRDTNTPSGWRSLLSEQTSNGGM